MTIKVLYMLVAGKHYTGGQRMAINLLSGLASHGDYDCQILVTDKKTDVARHAEECGIRVKEIPYPKQLRKFGGELLSLKNALSAIPSFIQYRMDVKKYIKKNDFDIVIAGNIRALLPVILLNKRQFRLVWNIFLGNPSRGVWHLINEIGLRSCDAVFLEYKKQAEDIFSKKQMDRYAKKFSVHYTFVDQSPVSARPLADNTNDRPLTVGFAATISQRKGFDTLYHVALQLKNENIEFVVAGISETEKDKAFSKEIMERIENEGLNIRFLGWQKDMKPFWESIDVFMLPSRNEGIPVIIREAMRERIPIVASNIGGVAEAVGWDKGAMLVEKNDVQGYCNAIVTLLNNPDKQQSITEYAANRFQALFSKDAYIDSVDKEIKQIVS